MIHISISMMTVTSLLFFIYSNGSVTYCNYVDYFIFLCVPYRINFSTATDLAMGLFSKENSGSVSSIFGAIQLGIAFLFSMLSGLMANGTMIMVETVFLLCSLSAVMVLLLANLSVSRNKVVMQGNKVE